MINVVRPWMIRWWTESKLASAAPLISIPTEIIDRVLLRRTAEEQERLATPCGRLQQQTLMKEHGVAWRVHSWQLPCISFPIEEEGDHHDDGKHKWQEEWEPANCVEGLIFCWLRGFMDDIITKSATILLLNDHAELFEAPVPSPLRQEAVMFCPLPGQVGHVQWGLRHNFFQVHLVRMLSEDSSDNRTELMNEFQITA